MVRHKYWTTHTVDNVPAWQCQDCLGGHLKARRPMNPLRKPTSLGVRLIETVDIVAPWPDELLSVINDFVIFEAPPGAAFASGLCFHCK